MEKTLQKVVRDLLSSYEAVGGLNNTDRLNLPSTRAIASICEDLLQLLFPGFHDEEPVHADFLESLTEARISSLAERLEDQIGRSLRTTEPDCPQSRAHQVLTDFFEALPSIREWLRTDIEAAYEGDPAALSSEEIVLSYPFIESISTQRLAHQLYKSEVPLLPRMMTEWAHSRSGIDIHPGAQIGTHFFIDHGTGVVIGETCRIGNHVKLYHGVTLGARSFPKDNEGRVVKGGKRHPDVADWVTIYPNSTILGGETVIGERSTIGANVFLMHSIPAQSLVVYEETRLKVFAKPGSPATIPALEWVI